MTFSAKLLETRLQDALAALDRAQEDKAELHRQLDARSPSLPPHRRHVLDDQMDEVLQWKTRFEKVERARVTPEEVGPELVHRSLPLCVVGLPLARHLVPRKPQLSRSQIRIPLRSARKSRESDSRRWTSYIIKLARQRRAAE